MRSLRIATLSAIAIVGSCIWSVQLWQPTTDQAPRRRFEIKERRVEPRGETDPVVSFLSPQEFFKTDPEWAPFKPLVADRFSGNSVLVQPQKAPVVVTRAELARQTRVAALPKMEKPTPQIEKHSRILLPAGDLGDRWPYPDALAARVGTLFEDPKTTTWAEKVLERLDEFSQTRMQDRTESAFFLVELDDLLKKNLTLQQTVTDPRILRELKRAHYAISRRIAIWRKTHLAINREHLVSVRESRPTAIQIDRAIRNSLDRVDTQLGDKGQMWREYLSLPELRMVLDTGDSKSRDELARTYLRRLSATHLDRKQTGFLGQSAFQTLGNDLRQWVDSKVDYTLLVGAIEAFEENPTLPMAHRVASAYNELKWAGDPALVEMAEAINTHYRNANVRVSMSADFINRLLPMEENVHEPVRDSILGAPVSGTSLRSSNVRVQLEPDGGRWRIGLQAQGSIASNTSTRKGPARFFNRGYSEFFAQKLVLVDSQGIWVDRAEATADTSTQLTDMETDFDYVPVLNLLVRTIVRQQYDNQEANAQSVVRGRVASLAQHRLDTEVQTRVEELKENFHSKTLAPLKQLGLKPVALHMETTDNRVIARYRLAGKRQLGAYSPRPLAPSGSIMSVQVHESSLNNTLESLDIAGRRIELRELYKEISKKLGGTGDVDIPEDIPQDVNVILDPKQPVTVRCKSGFVNLELRVKELSTGSRRWRNFNVYAKYVPHTNQLTANLRREDTIQLESKGLRFRDRVALRGIFTKVLSRTKSFDLVNRKLQTNPRLSNLKVVQFTIRGGWISVAIAPTVDALVARRRDLK